MIPQFEEFLYPFLLSLKDGNLTTKEMRAKMVEHFKLTAVEELESILEDNNIDHESLSYPIDYHDLEDLRDEYESLLEKNNIDY